MGGGLARAEGARHMTKGGLHGRVRHLFRKMRGGSAMMRPGHPHPDAWQAFATNFHLTNFIRDDVRANPRDPKAWAVLIGFRVAQGALLRLPKAMALFFVIPYRIFSEWLLGIELRPKTIVGSGLTIFHGYGLTINDHSIIGSNVVLRNGVTIGHQRPGGRSPVVEDQVQVGASALILGPITVGEGAQIGAGAVVVTDIPARAVAIGNPAKVRGAST